MKIFEHVTVEINENEQAVTEITNIDQAIKLVLRRVDKVAFGPVWERVKTYDNLMDNQQTDVSYEGLTNDQIENIRNDHVLKQYDIRGDIKDSLLTRNEQLLKGKKKPRMDEKQVKKKLHVMYKKEIVGTKESEGIYKIFKRLQKDMSLYGINLLNAKNQFDSTREIEAMDDIWADRKLINDLYVFSGILYKMRQHYVHEYQNMRK